MAWRAFAAVFLLASGGLLAQQETPPPVFRVTSTRVVVEFIAMDQKGRFVNDLGLSEIEIEMDGKRQEVSMLLPPGSASHAVPVSLANAGQEAAPDQPPVASADLSSARTVILLDSRVLDASNFRHSVTAIRQFIHESLQADHLVMIAEIDRGLKIRTPFSREKVKLLASVDSLQPATVYNPLELAGNLRLRNSSVFVSPFPDPSLRNQVTQYIDDLHQQIVSVRQGLRLLCYSLSGMPGRKHVVFFSEGYPVSPLRQLELGSRTSSAFGAAWERQAASRDVGRLKNPGVLSMVNDIVSIANNFGVTIYTVDARGLVGVPGLAADNLGDTQAAANRLLGGSDAGTSLSVFKLTTIDDLANTQNTLLALAAGTNGSAFFNSNDLGAVLRSSTREQRSVYLASFVPRFKKGKRDKFRRIKVKTNRDGVLIRSQTGFLDADLDQIQSRRLAMAFKHPDLFRNLSPVIQVSQQDGQTQAVIGVPASQISARPNDGQFEIEILFAGRILDQQGKPVSDDFDIVKGFKLPINREQMVGLSAQPLLARQGLQLSSGQYRLMLAVEDRVSGALGVGWQEFHVP